MSWESLRWNLGVPNQVSKDSIGITTQNSWIQLKWWSPEHFDDRGRGNSEFQTTDHWSNCRWFKLSCHFTFKFVDKEVKSCDATSWIFWASDLYSRRRWRRIQHIFNEFWRKEFLTSLQAQSKLSKLRHNLTVGDIVLLKTEVDDWNYWPRARFISCETDDNSMVWSIKLRVGKSQILQRPVDKTVLLLENEMIRFPNEGSHT